MITKPKQICAYNSRTNVKWDTNDSITLNGITKAVKRLCACALLHGCTVVNCMANAAVNIVFHSLLLGNKFLALFFLLPYFQHPSLGPRSMTCYSCRRVIVRHDDSKCCCEIGGRPAVRCEMNKPLLQIELHALS